jgi:hypothetical protein
MTAREIDQAVGELIDADDLIGTLGALAKLRDLIAGAIDENVHAALKVHSGAEVARALKTTRQQISRRYAVRRAGAPTPTRRRSSGRANIDA